jgi:ABC-2 type transport system ATP-binding protein
MNFILEIKELTKHYFSSKNKIEALKGVSFGIKQGEVFSLLGANGAGKTTLSSLLATIHPRTSGEIIYNGRSIYEDLFAYRKQVGYCPQRPNLNPFLTLQDNLIFAGRFYGLTKKEVENNFQELALRFSLFDYLREKPNVLSGGWRQRFMLARSIIHKPSILILDEPTVALDPHIRRQIWDIIKDLKKTGVSVILTTHYLDEAEELSDRVCILDQGRIKLIDEPKNLKADFKLARLEDVFLKLMEEETAL